MDLLNKDQLWSLMEVADEACVSIYLPTHSAGDQIQQDPIRLKNLLRIAEEKLTESGMRSTAAKDLLEPARVLLDDDGFWRHGTQELAIFVAPGFFRYYRLPVEFKELVVVTGRFHIKPLLSLLLDDGSFYILALSQKRVRLLRGTRHSVEELDIVCRSVRELFQAQEKTHRVGGRRGIEITHDDRGCVPTGLVEDQRLDHRRGVRFVSLDRGGITRRKICEAGTEVIVVYDDTFRRGYILQHEVVDETLCIAAWNNGCRSVFEHQKFCSFQQYRVASTTRHKGFKLIAIP